MWFTILGELASQWLSNKKEKSQATHQATIKQIEEQGKAETSLIAQMAGSWKDEYWTVVVSLPIWITFYAVYKNDPEIIARMQSAFTVLENLPAWFQIMLGTAVLTSFGVKVHGNIFKK